MKGDFTRFTHDPSKHFTRVLKQQGRVDLDADWNELVETQIQRERTEAGDVIGPTGAPKSGGGLAVTDVAADGSDVSLSSGRLYLNGILCRLEETSEASYLNQPDFPGRPALQPPQAGRTDLVYLDVWERHVSAIEDPDLKEPALGGPDTTTRTQTVWQVRVQAGVGDVTCADEIDNWPPAASGGLLTSQASQPPASDDPCTLSLTGGFRGLENRLYRVEIHDGDTPGPPTFKWSRDNGSVVFAVEEFIASDDRKVKVKRLGRDQVLALRKDDWVEVLDNDTELNGQPGRLAQVTEINEAERILTLSQSLSGFSVDRQARVRRWDQKSDAVAVAAGPLPLEDGIEVSFAGSGYRTGDYWAFAARSATGEIEALADAPPQGIKHHYCKLALVTWRPAGGGNWQADIEDCRPLFPPLTNICAEDVCYDNSNTPALGDVSNVQEAIEALYAQGNDGCTLTLLPGPGWEAALALLDDVRSAHLCFQNGDYPLRSRVTLSDKESIKVSGFGPGTRIVAQNDEAALVFNRCQSVTIRDVYVESRRARPGSTGAGSVPHLNGALTFLDCGNVNVESVALKCASAAERAATCISVINTEPTPDGRVGAGSARIRHSDLRVGHQQVGILLVNVTRSRVEDNMIRVGRKPRRLSMAELLKNKRYRSAVRGLIMHRAILNPDPESLVGFAPNQVLVSEGRHSVLFETEPSLVGAWNELFQARPPRGVQSHQQLYWHVQNVADRLLLNQGRLPGSNLPLREFRRWYGDLRISNTTTAAQGIVVGGSLGEDVQIHRNTIVGAQQGIHAGASHQIDRRQRRQPADSLGVVHIVDNVIEAFLAPAASQRHGIFVGNCDSVIIQNNFVTVRRFPATRSTPMEGVRVHGFLGRMMIVRQSHLVNCTTGVLVEPLQPAGRARNLWLVADNVMPGAGRPVVAPESVQRHNNIA